MGYIPNTELRKAIKPHRDSILKYLQDTTNLQVRPIGDTEICLGYSFDNNRYRSNALECSLYGSWEFVEIQDESDNNYHYSRDLELRYNAPAQEVVNKLLKVL
jgi:hypothetical protein